MGITPCIRFLDNPTPCVHAADYLLSFSYPQLRKHKAFPRSQCRFCEGVGLYFPPGFMGVNTGRFRRRQPLSFTFWLSPLAHVGLWFMTMGQHIFACAVHTFLLAGIR